jgi:SM-20-related protein
MQQISNHVFCDDRIAGLKLNTRLIPNPYYDTPYLLIENFLSGSACRRIAEYTRAASEAEHAMIKSTHFGVVDPDVDERIRKTAVHKIPERLLRHYRRSFLRHQGRIEEFFRIALTTTTEVQALEYTEGAFYIKHADDSNELLDAHGETAGFVLVAPQRKITTVLFATSHAETDGDADSFSGGELCFNYLCDAEGSPIVLRPRAGDMLVFPSNPVFSHEVFPVTKGYRLTLVQWHNGIIA